MRLLSATVDRAGSGLMEEPTLGMCAQDGHGVRQRTPMVQPASGAKTHAEGGTK